MSKRSEDETEVLRLDSAWNDAYRRHDRSSLDQVLADDFTAIGPTGEVVTKASLMVDPPVRAKSVTFSEQSAFVFGDTGVSWGRLELQLEDRQIDQRFLRVFARRADIWRAVSVAVTPVVS
jgi:ketosteroid isomerase-like protein